jgi:hypothetical protein
MLPERDPASQLTDGGECFSVEVASRLKRTDLQVIYIGQSQGREFERRPS